MDSINNVTIHEISVGLNLFESLINRAIFNYCSVILFEEQNPEKFAMEVAELARRHSDTVTIYKTLEGKPLFASDLHFNPYKVQVMASVAKASISKIVEDLKDVMEDKELTSTNGGVVYIDRVRQDPDASYEDEIEVKFTVYPSKEKADAGEEGQKDERTIESFVAFLKSNNYDMEPIARTESLLKDIADEMEAEKELEESEEYGNAKGILKIIDEHQDDIERVYKDYSGRAMYGDKCFGIIVAGFAYEELMEAFEKMGVSARSDNMGREMIIYWPNYSWEEMTAADDDSILVHIKGATDEDEDEDEEATSAAKYSDYAYYSLNDKGDVISGWTFQQDAKDDKKESDKEDRGQFKVAKIVHHSRVDKKKLEEFNKKAGFKGNKAPKAEAAYDTNKVIEALQAKGYMVIDEGAGNELDIYVAKSKEEFANDIYVCVILDNGEFVDMVNSGNFKEMNPTEYKEIEDSFKSAEACMARAGFNPDTEMMVRKPYGIKDVMNSDKSISRDELKDAGLETYTMEEVFGNTEWMGAGTDFESESSLPEDFIMSTPQGDILVQAPSNYIRYAVKIVDGEATSVKMESLAAALMPADKKLAAIKKIVDEGQYSKIEGKIVDGTTANMLMQVIGALNEENKNKFLSMPILKMVEIGWKCCSKSSSSAVAEDMNEKFEKACEESEACDMATAMSVEEVLGHDDKFKYQLLSRMQSDCEYYTKTAPHSNHLWAGSPDKQIEYMKAIWNNLVEKPEWLSMEQIEGYEKEMANKSTAGVFSFNVECDGEFLFGGTGNSLEDACKKISGGIGFTVTTNLLEERDGAHHGELMTGSGNFDFVITSDDEATALHPTEKGGQEIKLQKIKDKHLDQIFANSPTGLAKHSLLDKELSDLSPEQITSVRKALVEVGNRNMGHDRLKSEDDNGKGSVGSDIAEFASWVTSDTMGKLADYLADSIGDRNAKDTYLFAKDKMESALLDFYRTEMNKSNYADIYEFWQDLIYNKKAISYTEDDDFSTFFFKEPLTDVQMKELADNIATKFKTETAVVDDSALNVYHMNVNGIADVAKFIGQNKIVEIA
jgi:hypothetical protein